MKNRASGALGIRLAFSGIGAVGNRTYGMGAMEISSPSPIFQTSSYAFRQCVYSFFKTTSLVFSPTATRARIVSANL